MIKAFLIVKSNLCIHWLILMLFIFDNGVVVAIYVPLAVRINKFSISQCIHMLLNYKNALTLRLLMSYIYGAPILDVSRSYTTTQHSR